MENNLKDYENVINEFKSLPIVNELPTFMEICKYPGSRFEEICSRILQFYFDPNQPHGLNYLWLNALNELLFGQNYTSMPRDNVKVRTEERVRGEGDKADKRLDITIEAGNQIIGIVNKITAGLYNNLDLYGNCFKDRYRGKYICMIVLSLRELTDSESSAKIEGAEFKNYTYQELFDKVVQNMGSYILHNNSPYVTYMFDFMQTLEHMGSMNLEQERRFFATNSSIVDELIQGFKTFNDYVFAEQKKQIKALHNKIEADWDVFEGWDLYTILNETDNAEKIGIECNYEASDQGACSLFRINITTWSLEAWDIWGKDVEDKFKDRCDTIDRTSAQNRVYLRLKPVDCKKDNIIQALSKAYCDLAVCVGITVSMDEEDDKQSEKQFDKQSEEQFDKNQKLFLQEHQTIKKLIRRRELCNNTIHNEQNREIERIKTDLGELNCTCFVWNGYNLTLIFNDNDANSKIGIEGRFEMDPENSDIFGAFRIFVTTWSLQAWKWYAATVEEEEKFAQQFGGSFPISKLEVENRMYMELPQLKHSAYTNDDSYHGAIIAALTEAYSTLKDIVNAKLTE